MVQLQPKESEHPLFQLLELQGNERCLREYPLYPRGCIVADRADGAANACGLS